MVAPAMASYADDYPNGKYYCCCSIDMVEEVDLKAQEVPLEELHVSQAPFAHLPFPDNFFDIVVSGSVSSHLN
jgi:ubiquinone/menaquinone biosynthesis C-methylase UbiE